MNITDNQAEHAQNVKKRLEKSGIRVVADLRNEKIGFKIRERTIQKIPYLLVVGDKEVEADAVAVRTRTGEDLGTLSVDAFAEMIIQEVNQKGRSE
jgi:threonyl-tRNA synthetase